MEYPISLHVTTTPDVDLHIHNPKQQLHHHQHEQQQQQPDAKEGAFSNELTHYMSLVNMVCMCTFVSVVGIVTNIINLIVWFRLGFRETVNIALFATSVSDLVSVTTTLWVAICYNPLLQFIEHLPFLPLEVQYTTGEMPHVIAMNATGWLTAYVTFERCLCISFPLKVKDILTTGRTKFVVVLIFFIVVALGVPMYWPNTMGFKFDPQRNTTVYGLIVIDDLMFIDTIFLYLANVTCPFLSFMVVAICSTILIVSLRRKSKWRQQSMATSGKEEDMLKRDYKVVKMILAVAIIFIACYSPSVFLFILSAEDPEFIPTGKLANNYYVTVSIAYVFETVNASVNIFVYYNMSSKYKSCFRDVFSLDTVKGP